MALFGQLGRVLRASLPERTNGIDSARVGQLTVADDGRGEMYLGAWAIIHHNNRAYSATNAVQSSSPPPTLYRTNMRDKGAYGMSYEYIEAL